MTALTPIEAVLGGLVLYCSSDPRIRDMAAENDEERFIEGCRQPWFDLLVGQGLMALREAVS